MGEKVSEYIETQTEYNDNDLFDVSAYLGVGSYESRKTLFSTLKEAIFPALSDVFTKDAENNVFYQGVTPTLGTSCVRNIFYQASDATLGNGCQENVFFPRVSGITLGTGCIKNIFEGGTNTTFANNLLNVVIKSSTVGGSDYTNLTNYGFIYNNTYPAIIFGVGGTTNYHQYYDIVNNRIVTTNLTTLAVGYIANPMTTGGDLIYGGASGVPTRLANGSAGQVLQSNGTTLAPSWATPASGGSTWTVVSTNQTAVNDGQYTVVANSTFTNPSPVEGKGYWVLVRNGTATINSVGYSVPGTIIYTVFHSGSWATYIQSAFNDATSSIQTQFTNINNRMSNLIDIATDGAATSLTSNTYSTGGLINPNQINAGDCLEIISVARKSAINGTLTMRFYVNTTNDLSGSPILIATGSATINTTRQTILQRFLRIKVKNGTGAGTEVANTTLGSTTDINTTNPSAVSTLAIDWTVNQYLIVALQNGSGSDSSVSTMFKVRR
jgi:hypothetical protein